MSISKDGKVRLLFSKKSSAIFTGCLIFIQGILSVVLIISLAANLIWPENSVAAAGTPLQIAYEGRLTDSSGNALGGTGTSYCYQFSIYDSANGGNKLWPASTPATTTATTTDGVFSAVIGQADTLTSTVFDFSTTSIAYLQVAVNNAPTTCTGGWEPLSPRQQLLSSPYALTANNVYGSYLKTDTVNGRVQVGTGAGQATPIYFALDNQNAAAYVGQQCSPNGIMWYDSNVASSQALICENGVLAGLGIQGTTTIAAVTANNAAPVTIGTINFSNSNNVSFGISTNGVVTASAAAGGATLSNLQWPPGQAIASSAALVTSGVYFGYLPLMQSLSASRVMALGSFAIPSSSSNASFSVSIFIYTMNASTLSTVSSGSASYTYSSGTTSVSSASFAGVRRISVPMTVNATPGNYWYGVRIATGNAGNVTLYGGAGEKILSNSSTNAVSAPTFSGNVGVASAASKQLILGIGTVGSAAMPASINATSLTGTTAGIIEPWILFTNIE